MIIGFLNLILHKNCITFKFIHQVWFKLLIPLLVAIFISIILKSFFKIDNWFFLIVCVSITSLIYLLSIYYFFLDNSEKDQISLKN